MSATTTTTTFCVSDDYHKLVIYKIQLYVLLERLKTKKNTTIMQSTVNIQSTIFKIHIHVLIGLLISCFIMLRMLRGF